MLHSLELIQHVKRKKKKKKSSTKRPIDKGKGIDRNIYPLYKGNKNTNSGLLNNKNKLLGKGNIIKPYLSI